MIDQQLVTKLEEVEASYQQTLTDMADPDIAGNQTRYTEVAKRHSELKPVVDAYHAYSAAIGEAEEARGLAQTESDEEMLAYLREQADAKDAEAQELVATLRLLLVPRDPNDEKDVIIEVRAAAG